MKNKINPFEYTFSRSQRSLHVSRRFCSCVLLAGLSLAAPVIFPFQVSASELQEPAAKAQELRSTSQQEGVQPQIVSQADSVSKIQAEAEPIKPQSTPALTKVETGSTISASSKDSYIPLSHPRRSLSAESETQEDLTRDSRIFDAWGALAEYVRPVGSRDFRTKTPEAFPDVGSDEWNKLDEETRKAHFDAFYGMDPQLKKYFYSSRAKDNAESILVQVYRDHPETGELQRVPVSYSSISAVPGETLYFFIKLNGHHYPMKNQLRLNWGFNLRLSHKAEEGVYKLDPYYSFIKVEDLLLDGKPSKLFDDQIEIYGETSKRQLPAPKKDVPYQGHKIIEESVARGAEHFISFKYTLPQNFWDGAWTQGSGSTGQQGGVISARAQLIRISPLGAMDVRYVLDDDYRAALNIDGPQEEVPISAREESDRFHIIESLEDKQLIEKSPWFYDRYEEYLFPLDKTFRHLSEDGASIVESPYRYVMAGPDHFKRERPTFESLIKEIPGYEYVSHDFELNQDRDYKDNELSPLPMFDYSFDKTSGIVRISKHFYVTYRKKSAPPHTPPESPEIPPYTPPEIPGVPPYIPPEVPELPPLDPPHDPDLPDRPAEPRLPKTLESHAPYRSCLAGGIGLVLSVLCGQMFRRNNSL